MATISGSTQIKSDNLQSCNLGVQGTSMKFIPDTNSINGIKQYSKTQLMDYLTMLTTSLTGPFFVSPEHDPLGEV